MPNKHNSSRRHHIPKMKFKVKNWAEYDAGLRRRGSLTLWVTPEVLDGWHAARRTTPGEQSRYSELAIENGHDAAPRISAGVASDRRADGIHLQPIRCIAEHA